MDVPLGGVEQHQFAVCLASAHSLQTGVLENVLRGHIVRLDYGDDPPKTARPERLPHDSVCGLARQALAPNVGMQVIADLDFWPTMLERLQAAIADEASARSVLDGPEAPAERALMLDLLRDLALDVLARVRPDPSIDLWIEVHLSEGIEVVALQRPQAQSRGEDREAGRQVRAMKAASRCLPADCVKDMRLDLRPPQQPGRQRELLDLASCAHQALAFARQRA